MPASSTLQGEAFAACLKTTILLYYIFELQFDTSWDS